MARLIVTVKEIRGHCPVYRTGDRIVLEDGYRLNLRQTPAVCMHSLAAVMPYYVAVFRGVDPRSLGLAGPDGKAHVQCPDPCGYTGGGTAVLSLEREDP